MKTLLITLSLAATAICQAIPIQISVTGTADYSNLGYVSGQSYTFNWVINESYSETPIYDSFSSYYSTWLEEETYQPMLFSSLTGDSLSGTFTQPSTDSSDPVSTLETYDDSPDTLMIMAGADQSNIGVKINDTYDIEYIIAYNLESALLSYLYPGSYTDPSTFFSGYTGTYAASGGGIQIVADGNGIDFTATEFTIAAIPEPSTFAFVGVFGGAVFAIRRFFLI